jgi:hypothetical protein
MEELEGEGSEEEEEHPIKSEGEEGNSPERALSKGKE